MSEDTGRFAEGVVPEIECAVCLQPSMYPVKVPCGHIFCFLCIKGVICQSGTCPMCRARIPPQYLNRPQLIKIDRSRRVGDESDGSKPAPSKDSNNRATSSSTSASHSASPSSSPASDTLDTNPTDTDTSPNDKDAGYTSPRPTPPAYKWFYQGKNGWWQYDERTAGDMEKAYLDSEPSVELMIAGHVYVVDLEKMIQFRKNEPMKKRKIKRDREDVDKKGVAGLRLEENLTKKKGSEKKNGVGEGKRTGKNIGGIARGPRTNGAGASTDTATNNTTSPSSDEE